MTEQSAGRRPLDGAQEYLYLGYGLLAVMLLTLVTRRIGPAAVLPALWPVWGCRFASGPLRCSCWSWWASCSTGTISDAREPAPSRYPT